MTVEFRVESPSERAPVQLPVQPVCDLMSEMPIDLADIPYRTGGALFRLI